MEPNSIFSFNKSLHAHNFSEVRTFLSFVTSKVFVFFWFSVDSSKNLPHWQSTQRWLTEPILSSRWVPLSRWHQTRRTTASSWTSLDPGALHPSLETWAQAWTHPTWAGPQWEWTSPGAKAWGLLGHTAKGCPSRAMQGPGLRAWVCRVWRDRTQERWADGNSTLSPLSISSFAL